MFDPEHLEVLARQNAFIQRSSSKLRGRDFVELMTTELIEDPAISLEGLCAILGERHPQAQMTPQALRQQLEPVCERLPLGVLAPCARVLLEDSTQCRLHAKLAEDLKGSGGSASPSALKLDVIYDVIHHSLVEVHLSDGTAADQGRALAIMAHLRPDDLVLRDLGYLSLESLRQIETHGAWYLSRLSKGVEVYLEAHAPVEALDLVAYLQKHSPHDAVIALPVSLGQERVSCRLLAYRLPEKVVEERRRKALEDARKKGRTLTQDSLNWLTFGWYITNVTQEVWSAKVGRIVYGLRWQVEFMFKNWQSLLKIHILKGTRPERIKCMLYGRLMTMTLMTLMASYASWYAEDSLNVARTML